MVSSEVHHLLSLRDPDGCSHITGGAYQSWPGIALQGVKIYRSFVCEYFSPGFSSVLGNWRD